MRPPPGSAPALVPYPAALPLSLFILYSNVIFSVKLFLTTFLKMYPNPPISLLLL